MSPRARSRPALRAAAAPLMARSHTYTSDGRAAVGAASTNAVTARRPSSVALWSTMMSSAGTTVWASSARTVSASSAGRFLVGTTALTVIDSPSLAPTWNVIAELPFSRLIPLNDVCLPMSEISAQS